MESNYILQIPGMTRYDVCVLKISSDGKNINEWKKVNQKLNFSEN